MLLYRAPLRAPGRRRRALAKTVTWSLSATALTGILALGFGFDLAVAGGLALADLAVKTVAYYAHERVWDRL